MWFCKGGTARSLSSDAPHGKQFTAKAAVSDWCTLPAIEGFTELWGTSIFHCPYCHGEVRDQPLAIYGKGEPDWKRRY